MPLIEHKDGRYVRSPTFRRNGSQPVLYGIAWENDREFVVHYSLDRDGLVTHEHHGPSHDAIVALTHDDPPQPTTDTRIEHQARDGGWRVEVRHEGPTSKVAVTTPDNSEHVVWQAVGTAASPAIAAWKDGAFVAFHHDVREDTGQVDLAKWIAIYYVDREGNVFEPGAEMQQRNRDLEGVEQSFEFPSLVVTPRGAISIFGRGSHNFWRQDLTEVGFGPRIPLSDGEWGSRGRRCAAILVDDSILIACRERNGVSVQRLDAPAGRNVDLRPITRPAASPAVSSEPPIDRVDRVDDPARQYGLCTLFGDIQQHSAHSDGIGGADEPYLRARFRYQDDFVGLTDHESFLGKRTGPGEWEYLQRVADHHDDAGRFATLIAYEWTGRRYPGPGHKCVYYPRTGIPIVSRDDVPDGADLVRLVRELGGFASPHHIGWTGCDEPGHDPEGQPLWEICSCHGCYEHADHPLGQRGDLTDQMVDTMLNRGHRFGFTASSDGHGLLWHHGESRKRDPFRTGLTAVQAPSCARDAIMNALMQRRCYATSGAKILLDFTADGHPMGSELPERRLTRFRATAVGTNDITCVELVGPPGVIAHRCGPARQLELEADRDVAWAYVRVVQIDGEMAWSSPVFLV